MTLEKIRTQCSYDIPNWLYIQDKMFQNAKTIEESKRVSEMTGIIHLSIYTQKDGRKMLKIPIGLWKHLSISISASYTDKIMVESFRDGVTFTLPSDKSNRVYQDEAAEAWEAMGGIGIFKIATGGGKTWIASDILRRLNVRTIILVPKKILIREWTTELKRRKIPEWLYKVTTYSSMYNALFGKAAKSKTVVEKRLELKRHFLVSKFIIVDECHNAGANQIDTVIKSFNGTYRLGLSATAEMRSDETDIKYISWLGPVVYEITAKQLVDDNVLAIPKIRFLHGDKNLKPLDKPRGIEAKNASYDAYIVKSKVRNESIVAIARLHKNKQILILVERKLHGKLLRYMIKDSEYVCGEDKQATQEEKTANFMNGKLRVLIATRGIIGEGFNYGGINILIMAGGGKSKIRSQQELGRGLRKAMGKNHIDVYDFVDFAIYLKDHSLERAKVWSNMGFEVSAPVWFKLQMSVGS